MLYLAVCVVEIASCSHQNVTLVLAACTVPSDKLIHYFTNRSRVTEHSVMPMQRTHGHGIVPISQGPQKNNLFDNDKLSQQI